MISEITKKAKKKCAVVVLKLALDFYSKFEDAIYKASDLFEEVDLPLESEALGNAMGREAQHPSPFGPFECAVRIANAFDTGLATDHEVQEYEEALTEIAFKT